MVVNRRDILRGASAGTVLTTRASRGWGTPASQTRAVLFDAFAIFDPHSVEVATENILGGRSAEFLRVWRTKQFEYTWLRTSGGVYKDFWDVTTDALDFAERRMQLGLQSNEKRSLVDSYLTLKPWPDVPAGISTLRSKGMKVGMLSNFTDAMLHANLLNAGNIKFDVLLSIDRVQRFKPDPRAYAMGETALNLPKEAITYVAFAGWDAVGATWFGYPTFWLNRANAIEERLSITIEATGSRFEDFLKSIFR